uniref:Uncharacterized protein n=1 Tax=Romanomermis culicivorax TaxID=13658 RepID=A0A915JJZ4_ROMCU
MMGTKVMGASKTIDFRPYNKNDCYEQLDVATCLLFFVNELKISAGKYLGSFEKLRHISSGKLENFVNEVQKLHQRIANYADELSSEASRNRPQSYM